MDKKASFDKYNHVNEPIFTKIKDNTSVLEVGCWVGAFGSALRQKKGCTVDGIDVSADALAKAEKTRAYRELYHLNLNDIDRLRIENQTYDYIVFGDVLEHLLYPERVLRFFLNYLAEDGKIMISLPNIGFILYRLKLLLGIFDYEELGVMDKTHVRFYTFKSMKELFSRVGLEIETIDRYNKVKPAYFILQILKNIFPRLFTLQFIFMLRPLSSSAHTADKEDKKRVTVSAGR